MPTAEALRLAAASAYFNLTDASATGGAVPLSTLMEFMQSQA